MPDATSLDPCNIEEASHCLRFVHSLPPSLALLTCPLHCRPTAKMTEAAAAIDFVAARADLAASSTKRRLAQLKTLEDKIKGDCELQGRLLSL